MRDPKKHHPYLVSRIDSWGQLEFSPRHFRDIQDVSSYSLNLWLTALCTKPDTVIDLLVLFSTAILPPPPARGPPITRPVPAKTKVFSILDRARAAMDQTYG